MVTISESSAVPAPAELATRRKSSGAPQLKATTGSAAASRDSPGRLRTWTEKSQEAQSRQPASRDARRSQYVAGSQSGISMEYMSKYLAIEVVQPCAIGFGKNAEVALAVIKTKVRRRPMIRTSMASTLSISDPLPILCRHFRECRRALTSRRARLWRPNGPTYCCASPEPARARPSFRGTPPPPELRGLPARRFPPPCAPASSPWLASRGLCWAC